VQTASDGRLIPDDGVSRTIIRTSPSPRCGSRSPDDPHGLQRPVGPFADDEARTEALDKDGEMPDWMANAIVAAMMDCYRDPEEHPEI
jgi:hypothetical protein